MALRSDTSLLWLCLGVSLGFLACRRLVRNLHEVPKLTEIRRDENDERMISQGTEDALKLETLHKLSESPSYELRGASLRIISERATKEASRDLLLEDLASKNKRRRDRALTAIHFLVSSRALARSVSPLRLQDQATFNALTECLCNFLAEHTDPTGTSNSPILPKTRPAGEKKALATLNILLGDNVPAALNAGVVTRWLANYPFPCLRDESNQPENCRKDPVWFMKEFWLDDTLMSSIFTTLVMHPEGARQLRKTGMLGGGMDEDEEDGEDEDGDGDEDEVDGDVWMVNGDDTAGRGRVPERLRVADESVEEQTLRRRRREAMVFSEAGRPLGNENIIERLPEW